MYKLLIVDDDIEVLSINQKYFSNEGYQVRVAENAKKALALLPAFAPDCIILDIMMPEMDGFQACRKIKAITEAPILFLSGKTSEDDKVKGLLLGADDYIVKPFSMRELSARIQVIIRRTMEAKKDPFLISYPPLQMDLEKRKVYCETEEILLSNREYELLFLFASKPNVLISFEEIGDMMWGTYSEQDRRTIMVTVSRLRKKLASYPRIVEMVESVWSKGYRFVIN